MSNVTDITGQTFGRLTALYRVGTKSTLLEAGCQFGIVNVSVEMKST